MKKQAYYIDNCIPAGNADVEYCTLRRSRVTVPGGTRVGFGDYDVYGGGQLCRGRFAALYSLAAAGQNFYELF